MRRPSAVTWALVKFFKETLADMSLSAMSINSFKSMFDLSGQVALVAGGYGGIGEAISWGLAIQGATVAISGRSIERATRLVNQLKEAGYHTHSFSFDMGKVDDIRRHVDEVVDTLGSIDILVNCVGTQREERAEQVTEAAWDAVSDMNLKGAFFLAQAAGRHQIKKGNGRQIHISSVRSLLALRGRGYAAYCATKGGLNLLVKQLAAEWAPYGILVNGIAPTFIRTELVRGYLEDEAFYNSLVERIPLGRIGDPVDVAGVALFLASPASAFMTGQILFLDGGITATQ